MLRRAASFLAAGTAAAVLVLGLSGCGTATFHNAITLRIEGAATPQQVSVFDPQMGSTKDWASRTAGPTSAASPYQTTLFATDTKMIFDGSPPRRVSLGLWLPEIESAGYFVLELEPQDGAVQATTAAFRSWSERGGPPVPPLPVTVASAAGESGWVLQLTFPADR